MLTLIFSGTFLVAETVKAAAYNAGELGLILESGRSPGEGNGDPLQYSCLENPMDGETCCRLRSMGLQRVEHDSTFTFTPSFS